MNQLSLKYQILKKSKLQRVNSRYGENILKQRLILRSPSIMITSPSPLK